MDFGVCDCLKVKGCDEQGGWINTIYVDCRKTNYHPTTRCLGVLLRRQLVTMVDGSQIRHNGIG